MGTKVRQFLAFLESLWPTQGIYPSEGCFTQSLAQHLNKTHPQLSPVGFGTPSSEHRASPPKEHPGEEDSGMGPDICAEEGFPSPQTHPWAPRAAAPHAHRRAGISSPPLFISFPWFLWSWTIRVVCVTLIMRPLLYRDSWYYSNINSVIIEIRESKFR